MLSILYSFIFAHALTLYRDLEFKHKVGTEHFRVYWSDGYPKNNFWLQKKENLPLFIYSLKSSLEAGYKLFADDNLALPEHIEVYILDTNLTAINPPLSLNDVSTIGAFTSDIFPEILINANIESIFVDGKYISLKDRLVSITLHELMHAHQYEIGLITKEDKENKNLWFIEGMAVGYQLYKSSDPYYEKFTKEYLSKHINEGFLYDDYYLSYCAGLFYKFLVENYSIDFNKLENIYDETKDKKNFIKMVAKDIGLSTDALLNNFYKNFNSGVNSKDTLFFGGAYRAEENITIMSSCKKPSNLKKVDFFISTGKIYKTPYRSKQILNFKKGWQMLGYSLDIDQNIIENTDGIFWIYSDGIWSCNGKKVKDICKEHFNLIKKIKRGDGFWLYLDRDKNITLKSDFKSRATSYKKGWNLSSNPTDKTITFDNQNLIWKYDKKWQNSIDDNITIEKNEGFWIKLNYR